MPAVMMGSNSSRMAACTMESSSRSKVVTKPTLGDDACSFGVATLSGSLAIPSA